MRFMKAVVSLIVILALLGFETSCSKHDTQDTVLGAVAMVIGFKTSQNYRGLWNASSTKFQRSNDGDPVEYEKYARSYGIHPDKIEVIAVDERNFEAKVRVRARYIQDDGIIAGSAVEEWWFVKENGGWFIDGYRTITEMQN